MRQLLNSAFSFHFKDVIWKTSLDGRTGFMALELRDPDALQTSFATIDIEDKKMGRTFSVEEADWWSALLMIQSGYLFIEKYQDPQNPTDKSLIVASADNGEVYKIFHGFQLQEVKKNTLILNKIADPLSQIKEQLPEKTSLDGNYDFRESMVFPEGSDNFEMVKSFLEKEIVSHVDYLEKGDYIIICYVMSYSGGFSRKIIVLKEEQEVFEAVLDEKMEGIAPGSFFVFKNYLIFIVERNQINGIEL